MCRVVSRFMESLIPSVQQRETNLGIFLFENFQPILLNECHRNFMRLGQIEMIYLQA